MAFDKISNNSLQFVYEVAADPENAKGLCHSYLEKVEALDVKVPSFDPSLEWLNVSKALSFEEELSGKICVLDFFTYCCINCMHILPGMYSYVRFYDHFDITLSQNLRFGCPLDHEMIN